MTYLLIALASFVYVGGKAFQQLNVVHDRFGMVPPTTFVLAICEVLIIGNIAVRAVDADWHGLAFTIIAMSIGASTGAMAAMKAHRWVRER